jgi:hypothetical protein
VWETVGPDQEAFVGADTRAVNKAVMEDPADKMRPGYPWMGFSVSDKIWSLGFIIMLIVVINIVFAV